MLPSLFKFLFWIKFYHKSTCVATSQVSPVCLFRYDGEGYDDNSDTSLLTQHYYGMYQEA